MFITFIVLLILFLILSVLSFMGKLTEFITGSQIKENTENIYNQRRAGNFIGVIMSLMVVATGFGMLGFLLTSARWLIIAAPLTFIAVLVFAIVFINTQDRFVDEKAKDKD